MGRFEVQTWPFSLHHYCVCVLLGPFRQLLDRARLHDCQRRLSLPLMPSANLFDAMFMHVVQWGKTHGSVWFLHVLISPGVLMLASAEMSLPVAVLELSGAFVFSLFTHYCQQCPSAVVLVLYLHVCSLYWQSLLNFLLEFEQLLGELPQQTQQTWIIL